MPTLLPYVHRFKDRHGRIRHYFRRPGFKQVALPGEPGSAEFMSAYQVAIAGRAPAASIVKPGSFTALFLTYYSSFDFQQLTAKTQQGYRSNLKDFEDRFGDWPVKTFTTDALNKYLGMRAGTPGAAVNFMKRFRTLMTIAVAGGLIDRDPCIGVRIKRKKTDGFENWDEADLAAFERRWPIGTKERLAYALALYTGQRRSDVVRLGRQHLKDGCLHLRQAKTNTPLTIPVHRELQAVLDASPIGDMAFLVTEYGRPFSVAGLGNWFADKCEAAGLETKRMHGLRKAAARRLAEAGCTAYEIIAITGHSSAKEAEPYTRAVDQRALAKSAMKKVTGTKLANLKADSGKP